MIGEDEERGDELRAIEFDRIRGGKPFDIDVPWFGELLDGDRPAQVCDDTAGSLIRRPALQRPVFKLSRS